MGQSDTCKTISRQFVANALGANFDIQQFKVESGSKPGDNFTSLIYSVDVEAKDLKSGENVTKHLLMKCYPVHPSRQDFSNKSNMFFKELEIYRLWLPELRRFQTEVVGLKEAISLPYPPFVSGKCIDFEVEASAYEGKVIGPLDNYIIMEDLRTARKFRMTNRRDPMDIDHIRLVVHELAKIHSLSWAYKYHVDPDIRGKFPCLVNEYFAEDKSLMMSFFESGIREAVKTLDAIKGLGNHLSKAVIGFQEVVETVFDVFTGTKPDETLDSVLRVKHDSRFGKDCEDKVPWRVICHGDCWSNNMLFKYDEKTGKPLEVVLVDLQIAREACVMPDLVYSIYACTDAALRKAHFTELMKLYVDTFNEFCKILKVDSLPGFSYESFTYRFHRFKLFGLLMALAVFPIMLKDEETAQAMNLEDMDETKSMADMLSDICTTSGNNSIYNERLVGIVQEMCDEGVI